MPNQRAHVLLSKSLNVFIPVYFILSVLHWWTLDDSMRLSMTALASTTTAIGVLLKLMVDRPVIRDRSNAMLVMLVSLVAINALAHMYLSKDIRQSTNFIFVIGLCGFFVLNMWGSLLLTLGVACVWLATVAALGFPDGSWHFAVMVALACVFAGLLNYMRRSMEESQRRVEADESVIQTLVENIPVGLLARGADSRIVYINDLALKYLDLDSRDEVMGQRTDQVVWELFREDGTKVAHEDRPVRRLMATGEQITNELLGVKHQDGSLHWLLTNAFMIDNQALEEPLAVSAFVDVTERINAERQSRESEMFGRAILNSIADGVVAVDEEERITHINPSAQILTGYRRADAIGRPLTEILNVKSGRTRRKDGGFSDVELLSADLLDRQQRHLGRVLTLRDKSEQIRLERERSMLDKMTSVGVLAGGIAHDFNNLLVGLYGNISLVQASVEPGTQLARHLDDAMRSLDKATSLTRQLLTFATGSEPVTAVTNLESLIREVAGFSLSGSSTQVEIIVDEALPSVQADSTQLHQAFSNILINGKQAMKDAGKLIVELRHVLEEVADDRIEVRISDCGPGIAPEVLDRIFDPYFTTKEMGTGLGLATTHSIIVKHGGTVNVETSGEGTTFIVSLPTTADSVDEGVVPEKRPDPVSGLDILVMDDERLVLDTVTRMLQHLGHEVTKANEGAEAVERYREQLADGRRFDFVIMDLTVVGGMGGREAAQQILALDPAAQIIVSSGYSEGAEMANYEELGFVSILAKPYTLDNLREALNDLHLNTSKT